MNLSERVLAALPQTQCTRCNYPDCAQYAQAIARGEAPINQCPPGGQEGVARLAAITGQLETPLNPLNGTESPRHVAWIDENWCIGCTLCIDACPTDAIFGSNKRMHSVIEIHCTGCELCLPVCPVDCIEMENISGHLTGWLAWSPAQATHASQRYEQHQQRLASKKTAQLQRQVAQAESKLDDIDGLTHSDPSDPSDHDRKRAIVQAALMRAQSLLKKNQPVE